MKIKSYFIIVLLCIVTLLFATSFVFAGNIGRAVYGVLTETYNGTSTNSSAGDDRVYIAEGPGINTEDKVEGAQSYSIGSSYYVGVWFSSNGWWGENPQDMSAYSGGRVYFSAKIPTTVNINDTGNHFKIEDTTGQRFVYFNDDNIKRIDDGSAILGTRISNDNQWHTYYIPLGSFTGLDLTNIKYLFVIGSPVNNNTVLVDNVYWTKAPSETRSFGVTVKNRSDNQVSADDKITWTQSAYRQSWTAAEQYIELDLDRESSNWYVTVYLDNGKASRVGLYCVDSDDSEIVLPMAWRIRPDLLPNSDGDTLQIARKSTGSKGLYDVGKNPGGTDWDTWSFMREIKAGIDNEDTVVWDLKGLHTVVWDHTSWDPLTSYVDRKPKIYFAADCSNAIGGLTYTATIVTKLNYE